jgi:hypothetical protein
VVVDLGAGGLDAADVALELSAGVVAGAVGDGGSGVEEVVNVDEDEDDEDEVVLGGGGGEAVDGTTVVEAVTDTSIVSMAVEMGTPNWST